MQYLKHCLVALVLSSWATTALAAPISVAVDSDQWEFQNIEKEVPVEHSIVEYLGEQVLSLRAGKAVVKGASFKSGVIEFDMAFDAPKVPSFYGAVFDVRSESDFIVWYMRPHRAASDDDVYHVSPFYNDTGSWQLYWDGHIGKGAFHTAAWNHVKIILSGVSAEIYMNDMDNPVMFVADCKRNGDTSFSGSIGFKSYVESATPAYYKNFTYDAMDNPPMKNTPAIPQQAAGIVPAWLVTDPVAETVVKDKYMMTEADRASLPNWTSLSTDYAGVANFARLGHHTDSTRVARVTVISERPQIKKFSFGYSEWARFFLNGQLLFSGDNEFGRTANHFEAPRDYRFQGVAGYFENLYLPLKAGANEIWVAVTDARAGWGLEGKFEDMQGIAFDNTQTANLDSASSKLDYCAATYELTGELHIPCVAVPTGVGKAYNVLDVEMKQPNPSAFTFDLNLNSVKLH